ncbi:hypothetical protein B0H13DRAFT_1897563 [Mycena leptocephala]|nr:hypothetical protein B0H13DRAFT_1897563 [Mycena leptocephala]
MYVLRQKIGASTAPAPAPKSQNPHTAPKSKLQSAHLPPAHHAPRRSSSPMSTPLACTPPALRLLYAAASVQGSGPAGGGVDTRESIHRPRTSSRFAYRVADGKKDLAVGLGWWKAGSRTSEEWQRSSERIEARSLGRCASGVRRRRLDDAQGCSDSTGTERASAVTLRAITCLAYGSKQRVRAPHAIDSSVTPPGLAEHLQKAAMFDLA